MELCETLDPERTQDVEVDENVTFKDLLLSNSTLEGLKKARIFKPSPIQLKAIPLGKLGLDLIVQAKSGTGKTCVFTVVSLEHILSSTSKALQVLILAPTREVALQIDDFIRVVASSCEVKCGAFIGGIGGAALKQDRDKLRSCQIAVGTPGRILHLMTENLLHPTNIRIFVLDEADKLLAPEFQDSINSIYSRLPENKQTIFLSATYPSYMASFATQYMRSPTFVRLNIVDPSLRGIQQFYKITPYSAMSNLAFDHKTHALIKLLSSIEFQQAIVFTNYQIKGESLCQTLNSKGWPAIFTSGSIDQMKRNYAMDQLKQFKCRILISTDLTSRGVDAQNVDLVISMDVPSDPETYLHRIGRAGRFGAYGKAVSFVTEGEETSQFDAIINSYKLNICQFNDDLNDVIIVHNAEKSRNRDDDVTIERVSLTREELRRSVVEYERHKSVLQSINDAKDRKAGGKFKDNNNLAIKVTIKDLENKLMDFKLGKTARTKPVRVHQETFTKPELDEIQSKVAKYLGIQTLVSQDENKNLDFFNLYASKLAANYTKYLNDNNKNC